MKNKVYYEPHELYGFYFMSYFLYTKYRFDKKHYDVETVNTKIREYVLISNGLKRHFLDNQRHKIAHVHEILISEAQDAGISIDKALQECGLVGIHKH